MAWFGRYCWQFALHASGKVLFEFEVVGPESSAEPARSLGARYLRQLRPELMAQADTGVTPLSRRRWDERAGPGPQAP